MKLYRAQIVNYGDPYGYLDLSIHIIEYDVIRQTDYFYIIKVNNKEKRVGKNSIKSYAAPTKEKSLNDLILRNYMQIAILKSKLIYAEKVKEFLNKNNKTK